MTIFLVILLVIVVVILLFAMNKIKYYKIAMGNMSAMVVMQKMFEIMASSIPAANKMKELNSIIRESFDTKYSTLVLFDGNEYEIHATNVEDIYLDGIKELAYTQEFKNNSDQNIAKYLVATGARTLGYKTAIERSIKSAMFSPIYYNGIFRGFWLMEDTVEAAYDSISKEELARLKDNIGVFVESISSQQAIENAGNTDKQTGFYNNLYLYSNLRSRLVGYTSSCIVVMQLTNLPVINEMYGREVGNALLDRAAKRLKEILSADNVPVRYSGSKFCVICPGVTSDMVHNTMERFLSSTRNDVEACGKDVAKLEINIVIHDIKKQSNIEKEINKMVNYVENSKTANSINIM